jgi:hypothetical protein
MLKNLTIFIGVQLVGILFAFYLIMVFNFPAFEELVKALN